METNSKKVLAALPDFEDYMKLAEEIKLASIEKMRLENSIRSAESFAFEKVMSDEKYFRQGKVVSVSYFENAYKQRGINGEIQELRDKFAEVSAHLENMKTRFEIYKMMQDMYRALAYQEKGMS